MFDGPAQRAVLQLVLQSAALEMHLSGQLRAFVMRLSKFQAQRSRAILPACTVPRQRSLIFAPSESKGRAYGA